MEASITAEQKESLLKELHRLYSQRKCIKWQLLSLIGSFPSHAKCHQLEEFFCVVLLLLTLVPVAPPYMSEARLDLQWWLTFYLTGQAEA